MGTAIDVTISGRIRYEYYWDGFWKHINGGWWELYDDVIETTVNVACIERFKEYTIPTMEFRCGFKPGGAFKRWWRWLVYDDSKIYDFEAKKTGAKTITWIKFISGDMLYVDQPAEVFRKAMDGLRLAKTAHNKSMEPKTYNKPMNGFYNFTPELAFKEIKAHWNAWDNDVRPKAYVVGISGGVDSTCVAALAVRIFGADKVAGVSLPCGGQSDMADVDKAFEFLGVRRLTMDIGDMFTLGLNAIENQALEMTDVCRTNMPARLRMTMLYGAAQCLGGVVVNTCNRSESVLGNDTLFGDDCGSYAPIAKLTKTEVKAIAAWLEAPAELVEKTPVDGLQPLSDEERLGVAYAEVDNYIRRTGPVAKSVEEKILDHFVKNRFKLEIVKVPGPEFLHYPDRIRANFGV